MGSPPAIHTSTVNQASYSYFSDTRDPYRPQDRFGIFPVELFEQRSKNISCRTSKERRLKLFWTYLPDWLLTLGIIIAFSLINEIQGYQREFDVNDSSLQYSHVTHERVPVPVLAVLAGVVPALSIVILSQLLLRSSWDTHTGLLGLVLSFSLSLATTVTIKLTAGRPRPDLIARCKPITGVITPLYGLSDTSICSASPDDKLLRDGFRSFPSGHSSTAFAGLGFLSLYLAGKLHLWNDRGQIQKVWITIIPLFAAGLIAISRTMDNRHHWQDTLIGFIIGELSAWFAYRYYYPKLSSRNCHKPHSPRLKSPLLNEEAQISAVQSHGNERGNLRHENNEPSLPASSSSRCKNIQDAQKLDQV